MISKTLGRASAAPRRLPGIGGQSRRHRGACDQVTRSEYSKDIIVHGSLIDDLVLILAIVPFLTRWRRLLSVTTPTRGDDADSR